MAKFGEDYDLIRWSDGSRDRDTGHLKWHESYPDNKQMGTVRIATVEFNPHGQYSVPRNLPVHPDEPLHPLGSGEYDLDDLVQFHLDNDSPPAAALV